jgi:chromosome segregation ATPase
MTQSSDRLDRIEALLAATAESQAQTQANLEATRQICDSNARAIEALTNDQSQGWRSTRESFSELGRLLVRVVDLLSSRIEALESWRQGGDQR